MVLEQIAIDMILSGWQTKSWAVIAVFTFVLVFDIVSDLMGIPT